MRERIYRLIYHAQLSSLKPSEYYIKAKSIVSYCCFKDSANEKRNCIVHYYINFSTFVRYHNLLRNEVYNQLEIINNKETQKKNQGMQHDVLVEVENVRLFGSNTLMVFWVLIASFCFGSLWVLSLSTLLEDVGWVIFGDVVETFNKVLLVLTMFALVAVLAILVVSTFVLEVPSGAAVCCCFTIYMKKMMTPSEPP